MASVVIIVECRTFQTFQVKFYIKSKHAKAENKKPRVYVSEILYCIAKSPINLSTILPFCAKQIFKKLKIKKYRVVMATLERACVQYWPFPNTSC